MLDMFYLRLLSGHEAPNVVLYTAAVHALSNGQSHGLNDFKQMGQGLATEEFRIDECC